MLAGLEPLDSGAIRIGGRDVTAVQPKDRDIAMVFQNYALYPHMSVADEHRLRPKGHRQAESGDRGAGWKGQGLLDLSDQLGRKPQALSGGQRQRVAMGRAIIREPSVFLMDEPLSNLDAKLRVQTRAQIAALQRRLGTTTVYVTHDQVEAMTMGDSVAVLRDGLLQQVGTPRELYDRPVNVFVARVPRLSGHEPPAGGEVGWREHRSLGSASRGPRSTDSRLADYRLARRAPRNTPRGCSAWRRGRRAFDDRKPC